VLMMLLVGAGRPRSGGSVKGRATAAWKVHRSCGERCWGAGNQNWRG
jgi:hypothetical protein